MSSSFKVSHASIPSPHLVSRKKAVFVKGGELTQATHIGYPQPKSITYKGNLHKLEKINITISFPLNFPAISLTRFAGSLSSCSVFTKSLLTFPIAALNLPTRPCDKAWPVSLDRIADVGQEIFPKECSGSGGSILVLKFTAWNTMCSFLAPSFTWVAAMYRLYIRAVKASTWLGYNRFSKADELSSAYFALRAAIEAELNTNLFNTSFSFVISDFGWDTEKVHFGGKSVDDVICGQIESFSPRATEAQVLMNMMVDNPSASLWEMQAPMAIPPQVKKLTLNSKKYIVCGIIRFTWEQFLQPFGIWIYNDVWKLALGLCFLIVSSFIIAVYRNLVFDAPC